MKHSPQRVFLFQQPHFLNIIFKKNSECDGMEGFLGGESQVTPVYLYHMQIWSAEGLGKF